MARLSSLADVAMADVDPEAARHMVAVCKTSDMPADGGLRVEMPGRAALAVFHVDGQYYVIDDLCTHGEASLADGEVEGLEIICPYHRGSFDLRTGAAMASPCSIPINAYASEVRGDTLYAVLSPV